VIVLVQSQTAMRKAWYGEGQEGRGLWGSGGVDDLCLESIGLAIPGCERREENNNSSIR